MACGRRSEDSLSLTALAAGAEPEVSDALAETFRAEGIRLLCGVAQDRRGAIVVDDRIRSSIAGVYAAGDVTDRDQFVYMAAYGAKLATKNALNGDLFACDNRAMPWVGFTDPQAVGAGLSERQAKAGGHAVKTPIVPLDQVPRARRV